MTPEVLAGVDIGSESVSCVVAEVDDQGIVHITGAGRAPTEGSVRQGVIVDLDGATQAVKAAFSEAESLSSWEVVDTAVSISGLHVQGLPGRGTVNIDREDEYRSGEVTWSNIEDATETAQLIKLPRDSVVLRTVKCGYSVDGYDRLPKPPVGLRAERLTADIYMITADRSALLNLQQVIQNAGRRVTSVFPSAAAGGQAVLTRDEMEMGVAFADIGSSTTDIAVYHSGTLIHLAVIPVGGDEITRDIQQMRIPRWEADRIKREFADVSGKEKFSEKKITASTFGGRSTVPISSELITDISIKRVRQMIEEILGEMTKAGIQRSNIPAGIVFAGGTSHLKGLTQASTRITGLPSEIGTPLGLDMSSSLTETPEFATAVGLILLSLSEESENQRRKTGNPLENIFGRIKGLFDRLR